MEGVGESRKRQTLACSVSTSLTSRYSDISIVIKRHISIIINTGISIRAVAVRARGRAKETHGKTASERERKKLMWGTTRKSSNYVEETTGIKKDNDVVVVFF